jgi:hypothetical protein
MQALRDFDQREVRRIMAKQVMKCIKNDRFTHPLTMRILKGKNKVNLLMKSFDFKFAPGLFSVLVSVIPKPDFFDNLPSQREHNG